MSLKKKAYGSAIRAYKRSAPGWARDALATARESISGRPIDDAVLQDYTLTPDRSDRARLNLVISNISPGQTFGGVLTGLDVFLLLGKMLAEKCALDLRVIATDADGETDFSPMDPVVRKHGMDPASVDHFLIRQCSAAVPVRAGDIFVSDTFWTTLNIMPLLDAQAQEFGRPLLPLIYMIQEYEPHMHPFSSAHMFAREAYDMPKRLWGIINSSNLFRYFEIEGHKAERAFVFEPVVNDKLRPYLDQVATHPREKKILIYGRPGIPRNCFPALRRGLQRWAELHPEMQDWEVVSAGTAHKPFPLGDGRMVESVGKLSLDDYAKLLLSCSAGVSLMASPHPSYPPLEMAHMGMRTVTNSYLEKDLTAFHPNIISTPSIAADALAAAIAKACTLSAQPICADRNPVYVRDDEYPFLPELTEAILQEIG